MTDRACALPRAIGDRITRAGETSARSGTFTLHKVQQMLGVSRAVLSGLIAAGFVEPARGARNAYLFTFRDLMLLRTAYGLQRSGIAPRKILRSLTTLKSKLPAEMPLTGLRITAVGTEVAVRDRLGRLEGSSGQMLLDFEVAPSAGSVAILDRTGDDDGSDDDGDGHEDGNQAAADARAQFDRGAMLEADDPAAAEQAYRLAIGLAPGDPDAYLNLGALLCEAGRFAEAIELYDDGVRDCPPTALVFYNRAIALEDTGRIDDAIASYGRSLEIDGSLADAHFNVARLHERRGDARRALRHFSAYRRLTV